MALEMNEQEVVLIGTDQADAGEVSLRNYAGKPFHCIDVECTTI